jgi:hypothetical protein
MRTVRTRGERLGSLQHKALFCAYPCQRLIDKVPENKTRTAVKALEAENRADGGVYLQTGKGLGALTERGLEPCSTSYHTSGWTTNNTGLFLIKQNLILYSGVHLDWAPEGLRRSLSE